MSSIIWSFVRKEALRAATVQLGLSLLCAAQFFPTVNLYASPRGNHWCAVQDVHWVVDEIDISGNEALDSTAAEEALGIARGSSVNAAELAAARGRLESRYRQSGYARGKAIIRVQNRDCAQAPCRVRLAVLISEGLQYHIIRIEFVGNRKVADNTLLRVSGVEGTLIFRQEDLADWAAKLNASGLVEPVKSSEFGVQFNDKCGEVRVTIPIRER